VAALLVPALQGGGFVHKGEVGLAKEGLGFAEL
jgi:hypothetical protein